MGLAEHYRLFNVQNRLLMTGHSHQAWPDVAFEGQKQAYLDAAKHLDEKWPLAFEKAKQFESLLKQFLNDDSGEYVFGQNTHELFIRYLSSQDIQKPFTIVTTDGEFHSLRRQVARLEEVGIQVLRIPVQPLETLASRISNVLTPRMNALVYVSHVFYETSLVFHKIHELVQNCHLLQVPILIDIYHSMGAIELSVKDTGLNEAILIGGGYKYMQLGEGNCFMRLPSNTQYRPLITGWFAEFHNLHRTHDNALAYPSGGNAFAGSTYDPVSHYRAVSVLQFFKEQGLTAKTLAESYKRQIQMMIQQLLEAGFPNEEFDFNPHAERAGFLSFRTAFASLLCARLRAQGVLSDYRGEWLRFGPAPYLNDNQINQSISVLIQLLKNQSTDHLLKNPEIRSL